MEVLVQGLDVTDEASAKTQAGFLRKGLFSLKKLKVRCQKEDRVPRSAVVRDLLALVDEGAAGDDEEDSDEPAQSAEGSIPAVDAPLASSGKVAGDGLAAAPATEVAVDAMANVLAPAVVLGLAASGGPGAAVDATSFALASAVDLGSAPAPADLGSVPSVGSASMPAVVLPLDTLEEMDAETLSKWLVELADGGVISIDDGDDDGVDGGGLTVVPNGRRIWRKGRRAASSELESLTKLTNALYDAAVEPHGATSQAAVELAGHIANPANVEEKVDEIEVAERPLPVPECAVPGKSKKLNAYQVAMRHFKDNYKAAKPHKAWLESKERQEQMAMLSQGEQKRRRFDRPADGQSEGGGSSGSGGARPAPTP